MNFYQIFLPIATVLYVLMVFVLRSVIVWMQTGINPFVFGSSDNAHDYIGLIYKFVVVATWISNAMYAFFPSQYQFLVPIEYLEIDWLQMIGMVIMILSFVWTSIAQYQMSKSWRIGINYQEKTELVTGGLFRISRNPVFLGVLLTYLGTFLIIPNMISFASLFVIFVTIQIQVRLEEEYLTDVHGQNYVDFSRYVRRWV